MNFDTQQSIRVASFNCNSIRKKIDTVRELLDTCDVLLCQEILLLPEDIEFLNGINPDFININVPSRCSSSVSFDGRPVGGLAIFWRRSLCCVRLIG